MKQIKRFFSVLLTLCMLMGMLPGTVFAVDRSMPFTDVENTDWFYDAVEYAYDNGIMSGTGETTFSPDIATTRSMIVTILHRMEGTPSVDDKTFADVPAGQWYTNAISWASVNDIVSGYGNGMFGPNDPITREQMAAILYRYVQYKEYDHAATGDVSAFADFNQISDYAVEALDWATGEGLISGVGNNKLEPTGSATRAQAAMILMRFYERVIPTDTPASDPYTVMFEYNYGNKGVYETVEVNDGDTADRPDNPSRSGYSFRGWYTAATGGNRFDFDTEITQDLTLYARWSASSGGGGSSTSTPDPTPTPIFYTVTFNSNGGSVVESQSVESGKTAVQPAEPTREDWNFSGWYTDEACTQLYDFSKPVTGDLNLYAKWVVADNAQDPPSTEVDDDDVYNLSCDPSEVEASSSATITFKVVSTLTVDAFELYCGSESTEVFLYDDGIYEFGVGDDIPNDGCYTGTYEIDWKTEEDIRFTAKAVIGNETIETNSVTIFVYEPLSESDINQMMQIDEELQEIMDQIKQENITLPDDELIIHLQTGLRTQLSQWEENGLLSGVIHDEENYLFTFVLPSGIHDGVKYYDPNDHVESSDDEGVFTDWVSTNTVSRSEVIQLTSSNVSIDYITYKERALLLCYDAYANNWAGGGLSDVTNNLMTSLENVGFSVDARYSVGVNDFKYMQDYDYINIACHGTVYTLWTSPFTNEKTPVICTPEQTTVASLKAYSADLKEDRLVCVNGYYYLRPSFFEFYYEIDPLKANIVSLGCCKGAYTDDLVDAILDAGASAVLAYSDTVYTAYDYMMSDAVMEQLYQGVTVSEALATAQDVYGENDLIWGAAQRDSGNTNFNTLKSECARCCVFGNEEETLHNSLLNGNFDSIWNLIGSNLISWKQYGDARSIYKLAGLSPISSPKMAIISSGFGSLNDETTSAIYQTFLVPEDATAIEFAYNIVSEEPMEWVGTQYNDLFQVELLDTDGNNLSTLAFESVNTSTWYAIDGIDFPGGDETTYHTRWITVFSNEIAKYQGQLVVLRFMVQDAGDAIYDTAALIDSIVIR